jgi:hypothetical protein
MEGKCAKIISVCQEKAERIIRSLFISGIRIDTLLFIADDILVASTGENLQEDICKLHNSGSN